MNLGSPDSTEVKDVTRYLKEFLMDGRVIDYPYLFRALLVKGLIVPARAAKSAAAYKTIWTKEGSPLVVLTEAPPSQKPESTKPTHLNSRRIKLNTRAPLQPQDRSKMRTLKPLAFANYQPLLLALLETWTAA